MLDRRKTKHGMHQNVFCSVCGMGWASPRPPARVYSNFYRTEYTQQVYGLDGTPESVEQVIEWRRRRSRQKIGYFPDFWKKGQRVLEIGAGIGTFLDVLREEHRAKVWGIEPSPSFVKFAREAFGFPLFHGLYEEWQTKRPSAFPKLYDRIVMDQILEHMLEPVPFLQSLHAHLAPEGQIFVSVPSLAAPKEPKPQFFIFEHVSSFSPYALCLLLVRCGFKPTGLFAEAPGSLQIAAAPFAASVSMLDPAEWGAPLTEQQVRERFAKL